LFPSVGLHLEARPQSTGTAQSGTAASKKAPAKAAPTAQEIADAKSKGLVWVNLSTHVYHKDGAMYGNTKRGKFMTEADAKKAGYRQAVEPKTSAAK